MIGCFSPISMTIAEETKGFFVRRPEQNKPGRNPRVIGHCLFIGPVYLPDLGRAGLSLWLECDAPT